MDKRCMGCMKTYASDYDVCPHCGYTEGTPSKEAYHMNPGTKIHNRYLVGKVIGYGGFGVTYIGWDTVLDQPVAIKEYLPSEFATRIPGQDNLTIYSGEKAKQFAIGKHKFADEAKRLAQFNAVEGVVEIKDTFSDNETAYIVMEYLEGETLKERIERESKIEAEETVNIISSVLKTLGHVHQGEIIHRDISPDNIFLCSNGSVKLLDFGASRYATVQHSKSLSVILKEGYAPEEQYRSRGEQGPWSDVYAVGATMYKMLTGVTPEDAMERAENDKLKPVSKYGVKLSKPVETAMMNAMNVFSEDRTQTAEEFLSELDADNVLKKERTRKKIDLGKWPLWSKILVGCISLVLVATGFLLSQKTTFALDEGQAYVPEIVNLKEDKATKKIEKNELTVKIIGQEKSNKVEEGKVMTQYPDAGRIVNTGELVEICISAGNTVTMVDLIGMTQEEAQILLEMMGFTKIEFNQEISAAPIGMIIKQSVKAGEDANITKKLMVTISEGLGEIDPSIDVNIPNFVGMQYNDALKKATNSKLYLVKGESKASDKPAGTILTQDLKKGNVAKQGTVITVVISSGNENVEVPYVTYLTEAEAERTLSAYNLSSSVSYEYSDTVSAGLVISQSVDSGKKVEPGSKVKLVVSKGRTKVSVPSVSGLTEAVAAQKIVDNDLRYTVTYSNSESVGWGKVISSTPAGKQEKGTKVTLVVSCGTAGKLVSESEYNSKYADTSKFFADKRYRYKIRQKEYSYFGAASKSGWTREGEKIIISGPTSSTWLQSNKDKKAGITDHGEYAEEVVKEKSKCYQSHAYFCECFGKSANKYGEKASSEFLDRHFIKGCDGVARYRLIVNSRKSVKEAFATSKYGGYMAPQSFSYGSPGGFEHIYMIKLDGANLTLDGFKSSNFATGKTHLWHLSGPFEVYRTITTKYQYKYWRYSGWSAWSDWTTRQSADGTTKKEDSTVMYYVVGRAPR